MSSGKLFNTSFSNLKTLVCDRKNTSSVWNSLKYEFDHILSAKVVFWYIFRYIFSVEIAKFWGGWGRNFVKLGNNPKNWGGGEGERGVVAIKSIFSGGAVDKIMAWGGGRFQKTIKLFQESISPVWFPLWNFAKT